MKQISVWLIVFSSLISSSAWAYLDPGTGSMLLQVILGGVAAVGVAIKIFWYRIRAAIGLGKKSETAE